MSMAENKPLGGGIVIERQTGSANPAAARNAASVPLIPVACIGIDALDRYLKRRGDWRAPAAAFCVVPVAALHSLVDFSLEMEVFLFLALLTLGVARGTGKPNEAAEAQAPA